MNSLNNQSQFKEIEQFINSEMKYLINADGGKISLVSVINNIVTVHLYGSCSRCAAINYTFYNVVQPMIKDKFPEIESVVMVK
jgi:Fe-S cluster biogenesis protein NfuA